MDVFEVWSEKVSSSYSATDCARSRARNRAVEEIKGSLEVRELDISIKSDEMRSWLRIKLIVDVDDQPVLGVTCLHCLHSAIILFKTLCIPWQGQIYPADPRNFVFRSRILILSSLLELFPTFKAVNIIINMSPTAAAPTPSLPDGRKSPRKSQRRVYFDKLQFISDRDRRTLKRQN